MKSIVAALSVAAFVGCSSPTSSGGGDDATPGDESAVVADQPAIVDQLQPNDTPFVDLGAPLDVSTTQPDVAEPPTDVSTPPPDVPAAIDAGNDTGNVAVRDTGNAVDLGNDTGNVAVRDTGNPVDVGFDTGPRDTGNDTGPRDTGNLIDVGFDTGPRDTGNPIDVGFDTGPRDTGNDVPVDRGVDVPPMPLGQCRALAGTRPAVAAPVTAAAFISTETEGWLGSPAVVNVTGDAQPEVIVTRGARALIFAANRTLLRTLSPGAGRIWASAVVADLTGDTRGDVAVAAGDRVFAYDATTGTAVTGFPARFRAELRSLAAGDVDANGSIELVTATSVPNTGQRDLITVLRNNGTALAGWPAFANGTTQCDSRCYLSGAFDQNMGLGDLDGDGRLDIVAPMDNAYISWHRPSGEAWPLAAGRYRNAVRSPGLRMFLNEADAIQGYASNEQTALQAHFTNSPPSVVDLDGDGRREIVVLSSVQNANQSNRELGVALWVLRSDGTRIANWATPFQVTAYRGGLVDLGGNIVAMTNQVSVGDLDFTQPGLDVVFSGFDGRIHAVNAARVERWSYAYTTAVDVFTAGVALADLNGDARPETIFATYSTRTGQSALHVLGPTGELLHRVALPARGSMAVPTVADVDGDGALEILVALKENTTRNESVLVWTVPGSAANCMPWPTGRAGWRRDGQPTL